MDTVQHPHNFLIGRGKIPPKLHISRRRVMVLLVAIVKETRHFTGPVRASKWSFVALVHARAPVVRHRGWWTGRKWGAGGCRRWEERRRGRRPWEWSQGTKSSRSWRVSECVFEIGHIIRWRVLSKYGRHVVRTRACKLRAYFHISIRFISFTAILLFCTYLYQMGRLSVSRNFPKRPCDWNRPVFFCPARTSMTSYLGTQYWKSPRQVHRRKDWASFVGILLLEFRSQRNGPCRIVLDGK